MEIVDKHRCPWPGEDPLCMRYHDEEWGVPNHEDAQHFEFLVLESAQAGLSWLTILRKRENYRSAYKGFDPEKVSKFEDNKIEQLLDDEGIVRNRRKVEASVINAKRLLAIKLEFGSFDSYLWQFVENKPVLNTWKTISAIPAKTELSDKVSKDLKTRGFKFIGSTIIYAYLQAVGVVNDHITSCFRYREINNLGAAKKRSH